MKEVLFHQDNAPAHKSLVAMQIRIELSYMNISAFVNHIVYIS